MNRRDPESDKHGGSDGWRERTLCGECTFSHVLMPTARLGDWLGRQNQSVMSD